MFIFDSMTKRLIQQNLKNILTTTFHIPPKDDCRYVNIENIRIDNRLAQLDYKTNYFAFLRKYVARIGNQSLVFSHFDSSTNMEYYILYLRYWLHEYIYI